MITKIYPKKGEIVTRIVLQLFVLTGLVYIIFLMIHPTGKHQFYPQIIIDSLFSILFLSLNLLNLYQLYVTPFWITINSELKTLDIGYLLSKSKIIESKDITGYGSTLIKRRSSRSMNYFGMFLHLSNATKILLSDQNLVTYTPVEIFLNELGIENLGEEDYRFFY